LTCHQDVRDFHTHLAEVARTANKSPESLLLNPGDWLEIPAGGGKPTRGAASWAA